MHFVCFVYTRLYGYYYFFFLTSVIIYFLTACPIIIKCERVLHKFHPSEIVRQMSNASFKERKLFNVRGEDTILIHTRHLEKCTSSFCILLGIY